MKKYTLTYNSAKQPVVAKSYLEALMEYSDFLKKRGQKKFTIEVSNENGRLGAWVR